MFGLIEVLNRNRNTSR